jgi:hypothetical protein
VKTVEIWSFGLWNLELGISNISPHFSQWHLMKSRLLLICLVVAASVGCSTVHQETSVSGPHLTEAQAIAIAKPKLPLPAGDSYRAAFKDGFWEVWTDRANSRYRSWTVVKIRDSDGQLLEAALRM